MVVAPESVKPFELPSLPLEQSKQFPNSSAIYFAIAGEKVLYIGRASSLAKRWLGHHRQGELENIGEVRIAWMEVSDPNLLPAIETALIRYFKPELNAQLVKVRKSKRHPGNPKPKCKFPMPKDVAVVTRKSIAVKLPPEIDAWVRSLPNRAEWLRQAIEAKYQLEKQHKEAD